MFLQIPTITDIDDIDYFCLLAYPLFENLN